MRSDDWNPRHIFFFPQDLILIFVDFFNLIMQNVDFIIPVIQWQLIFGGYLILENDHICYLNQGEIR